MLQRLPSLESLRIFEACGRHRNFTRAAAELSITPSAVSLRIRNLEKALNCALFERSGPNIALTVAGQRLASQMTAILALIRREVDACRGGSATLRVSCTPTFAARWLTPRLHKWHASEASTPIKLQVSTHLEPNELFDVAIRSGHGDWPGLISVAMLPIERTPLLGPMLARSTELRTPADLLGLSLLPDDAWKYWFDDVGVDGSAARFDGVSYPTQELSATAVMRGAGVALLSPSLFKDLLDEGKLVAPFSHVARGPDAYHVLKHTGPTRSAVDQFCTWMCDEIGSDTGP